MKCGQHSCLLEDAPGFEHQVNRLELSARAVDKDDRAGNLGPGDLLGHHPALADMVQHNPEAELLRESQDRHDVVVTVRVMMNNPPPLENLDEALHAQIARWFLFGILERLGKLVPVFPCTNQLSSHQSG